MQAHTSEAAKLSSKAVGANLVRSAKEVRANGGKAGWGTMVHLLVFGGTMVHGVP